MKCSMSSGSRTVLPPAVLAGVGLIAIEEFELQDILDRKPTDISFGQRKTVAIARPIAASPAVLLLDEPGAGPDDHEAAELATVIRRIAHDRG